MFKKYKFAFNLWAIILFLAMMLPYVYWFIIPAPNDILRTKSVTPILDNVASICQTITIALLCLIQRNDVGRLRWSSTVLCTVIWYVTYIVTWFFYYQGNTHSIIIVLLCLMPCLALGSYMMDRKNYLAILPLLLFSICHLLHGILNFIV